MLRLLKLHLINEHLDQLTVTSYQLPVTCAQLPVSSPSTCVNSLKISAHFTCDLNFTLSSYQLLFHKHCAINHLLHFMTCPSTHSSPWQVDECVGSRRSRGRWAKLIVYAAFNMHFYASSFPIMLAISTHKHK